MAKCPICPVKYPTSISHRQFGDVCWFIELDSRDEIMHIQPMIHKKFFLYVGTVRGIDPRNSLFLCLRYEVAGGIMFSGCPSVRTSVIALSEEPIDGFLPNFGDV